MEKMTVWTPNMLARILLIHNRFADAPERAFPYFAFVATANTAPLIGTGSLATLHYVHQLHC